jgi:hypothetical protein
MEHDTEKLSGFFQVIMLTQRADAMADAIALLRRGSVVPAMPSNVETSGWIDYTRALLTGGITRIIYAKLPAKI